MADAAPKRMTLDEFLAWDDGTDQRYELVDGVPVAMAPTRPAHGTLVGTLSGHLFMALQKRPPCRVQIEAGVRSPLRAESWFEADLAVTCAPIDPDRADIADPVLIVEILSPSTESHDRRRKLPVYRALPSVREILLVAQDEYYAELHRRLEGDRWLTDLVRGPEAVLRLDSVGLDLPLAALYANVPIAPDPAAVE